MIRRCDGSDPVVKRRIGDDEPLEVKSASEQMRAAADRHGGLTAMLDAQPFDRDGRRKISFKLGGDIGRLHESRTRVEVKAPDGKDGRWVACDCGRLFNDDQFEVVWPHLSLRPDPFDTPVLEHD